MTLDRPCFARTSFLQRNRHLQLFNWWSPYSLSKRKCHLCLNEKIEINSYKGNKLLEKRLELINKCRHINKHSYCDTIAMTISKVFHVSLSWSSKKLLNKFTKNFHISRFVWSSDDSQFYIKLYKDFKLWNIFYTEGY